MSQWIACIFLNGEWHVDLVGASRSPMAISCSLVFFSVLKYPSWSGTLVWGKGELEQMKIPQGNLLWRCHFLMKTMGFMHHPVAPGPGSWEDLWSRVKPGPGRHKSLYLSVGATGMWSRFPRETSPGVRDDSISTLISSDEWWLE
jgi:hypothetical protein